MQFPDAPSEIVGALLNRLIIAASLKTKRNKCSVPDGLRVGEIHLFSLFFPTPASSHLRPILVLCVYHLLPVIVFAIIGCPPQNSYLSITS